MTRMQAERAAYDAQSLKDGYMYKTAQLDGCWAVIRRLKASAEWYQYV